MIITNETAVAKALTTLRRLKVPHCVIYKDVAYGDLKVIQPTVEEPKPPRKKRVYDLHHLYQGVIEQLDIEEDYVFQRMDAAQAERLRKSVAAKCCQVYGNGSCETNLTRFSDGTAQVAVRRLFNFS